MNNPLKTRGMVIVISSPSGAGKTTIANAILESDEQITMSISVTTREKRENERDGKDYKFISKKEFDEMVASDQLLENAMVFGHHYGTPRFLVEEKLEANQDVLFDVNWEGAESLKSKFADLVRIFVLPPSIKTLEERLRKRGQDSEQIINLRMSRAKDEISKWSFYDYVIINDDLQKSIENVKSIIKAERLKKTRQASLSDFVLTQLV